MIIQLEFSYLLNFWGSAFFRDTVHMLIVILILVYMQI